MKTGLTDMKKTILFGLIAIVALASCNHEIGTEEAPLSRQLLFTASMAESQNTKTVIQDDGVSLWWTTNEQINAFYGSTYSGKFTSTNAEPSRIVQFSGNLNVLAGGVESGSGQSRYWAVYPYSETNTCDGESISLELPAEQASVAGTVADKLFPAVATSSSLDLAFYNVCGGARFCVSGEGIEQIALTAINGESLAGRVRVSFNDSGRPGIKEVLQGASKVVINAPSGGFVPGQYYYAALLPGTLSKGLQIEYIKSGARTAKTTINKAITIHRAVFGKLDNLDSGLVFSSGSSSIISFADEKVKQICVANWDTDGDGELSYTEAAAVKSIGTVFSKTKISSFDEFQFFTGVTSLEIHAFSQCESLVSIILPSGLTSIGTYAFSYCSSLVSIHIPESVSSIGAGPFGNCSRLSCITGKFALSDGRALIVDNVLKAFAPYGLTTWSVPAGVRTIEDFVFSGSKSLRSVVLPSGLTKIGFGAFQGCQSMTTITLPSSLTTIVDYAFISCTSLVSVHIPDNVTYIGTGSFSSCTSLNCFSGKGATSDGRALIDNNILKAFAPSGITTWSVPEGITEIDYNVFSDCMSLVSISLPSSLIKIGYMAFHTCSALSSINFPSNLQTIGGSAFASCTSLPSVTLPSSLKSIDQYAFYNCSSLSYIECLAANPPAGNDNMFQKTNNCPIYVPEESLNLYKTADYWNVYADRITPVSKYVDMGLSVKWAKVNLGASKPSDRGDYYAWAEVEPRMGFTMKGYKYVNSQGAYSKYFTDHPSSVQFQLEAADDAATVQWGNGWRMPTVNECEELFDSSNCSYEHVTIDGVSGIELTSKRTGNKIFLPAGGRIYDDATINWEEGKYWTATVDYAYNGVFALLFYDVGALSVSYVSRYQGLLIRPVHD